MSDHLFRSENNTHMNPNTAPKNSAPYVLSSAGSAGAAPEAGALGVSASSPKSKERGKYMEP